MLQESGLPILARVGELIELIRRLSPRPMPTDEIVRRAGLADLAERRMETLSGGESQRVRFAMAIAGDPDLLFLDEPTVAMDVETRRAFWADMRAFAAEGRTILFATHYLEEADQVADRIVVLDHGRIVADGTAASIKAACPRRGASASGSPRPTGRSLAALPGVDAVEIAGERVDLESTDPDATARALLRTDLAVHDLEIAGPDLEAAFLALTGGDRSSHQPKETSDDRSRQPRRRGSADRPVRAMAAYLALEIRRAVRNRRYLVFAIGFPVVFYLLYTGVLHRRGRAPTDPTWTAYFLVSMAAYGMIGASLSNAIPIAQERASGWTRQLRITPLPAVGMDRDEARRRLPDVAAVAGPRRRRRRSSSTTSACHRRPGSRSRRLAGDRRAAVRRTRAADRVHVRRERRPGRVTITLHHAGDPRRALGAGVDLPGHARYDRPDHADVPLREPRLGEPRRMACPTLDVAIVAAWAVAIFGLVAWRYRVTEQRARG